MAIFVYTNILNKSSKMYFKLPIKKTALLFLSWMIFSFQMVVAQEGFDYKDIPLSWRNFTKKDVHRKSNAQAVTAVKVFMSYEVKNRSLSIEIDLKQLKKESWVSKQFLRVARDEESLDLLNHERLHYAIHLIGFKNLYENLENFNFTSDYESEIASIFSKYQQYTRQTNQNYDFETRHGRDLEKQNDWAKLIFSSLNEVYLGSNYFPTRYIIIKTIDE